MIFLSTGLIGTEKFATEIENIFIKTIPHLTTFNVSRCCNSFNPVKCPINYLCLSNSKSIIYYAMLFAANDFVCNDYIGLFEKNISN